MPPHEKTFETESLFLTLTPAAGESLNFVPAGHPLCRRNQKPFVAARRSIGGGRRKEEQKKDLDGILFNGPIFNFGATVNLRESFFAITAERNTPEIIPIQLPRRSPGHRRHQGCQMEKCLIFGQAFALFLAEGGKSS